jgi:aminoglycoside 3-N-acetyltransferase
MSSDAAVLRAGALASVKQRLKPLYRRGQRLVARALFAYSPGALEAALRDVGIAAGDAVLVHSGFRPTSGFTAAPADVIEAMLRVVGPGGHLLMMSIPYRGSSQRYAESQPVFDVRRTPSAVGVISEVFRRRHDVVRSASPLHPIVAHGPLAAWLTADHDTCPYSCGPGTPFERFATLNGKFLFFDAPYSSLTFMHYVEHRYRDRIPVVLYEREPLRITVRNAAGLEQPVRQFVFSAEARARRNFAPVEQALRREGRLHARRIGNTRLLTMTAADVLACTERIVNEGPGLYR